MTDPQQEYIITEDQVKRLENSTSSWARVVASELRSQQFTAICPYNADDDMCLECKAHEVKISAKAIQESLARLRDHFRSFEDQKRFAYSAADIVEYIENFMKLEALREAHR